MTGPASVSKAARLLLGPALGAVLQAAPGMVTLGGDLPPELAGLRPLGPVDPDAAMGRMLLALKPPPGAGARLERFLQDLQDPRSPRYHRWLTPDQFGARFGAAPRDLERVTAWLQGEGFTVDEVAPGRLAVTFSGTAATVERAFRTPIRTFRVDGRVRQGNLLAPSIPRDLEDVVAGVVSLNDLPRRPGNRGFRDPAAGAGGIPAGHHLVPGDFAAIYHLDPLYQEGIDGRGVSVAVVARTRVDPEDTAAFRRKYGLAPRPLEVIVNGPDPGILAGAEAGEANLDAQWCGAVARAVTIRLVASASTAATDGVDLSAQYIVQYNLAPVLSASFGQCEQRMTAAGQVFYKNLWAQAAAQGISVVAAAGDSGPAACDPGDAGAGSGRAVSGLASTPYNVAVGGTQFEEGSGHYWKDSPDPDGASALGYIPEAAWNESRSVPGGSGLWAAGGGTSILYPKPAWQAAPGVPANGPQYQFRCVPDLALAAALGHDGYLVETGGAAQVTGGTSCSAPAFAGLLALVVQKTGQRQGNPCPALYRLGTAQYRDGGPAVFHDITQGDTCVPGTQGYSCRPRYDLATGLGSVDGAALVDAWSGGRGGNVDARILQPAADRTVASGTVVAFLGSAQAGAADLGFTWDFGDGATGEGPARAHRYLNPGQSPLANQVTLTVRDGAGAQGSDTRTLTVLPPPLPGELVQDGGFELGSRAWTGHGVQVGDNSARVPAHQGRACAWFPGGRAQAGVLQQTVAFPAKAASARLTFWLRVDTREPAGTALDAFQVKARGADGRLAVLGTWTNLDQRAGYFPCTVNMRAYLGQRVQLSFVAASFRHGRGTDFTLDDVSLAAP